MKPRPAPLLPLAALLLSLLPSGCGKKLPTAFNAGQGFPRTVLVEVFTSESCTNCPKADAAAEQIAAEMGDSLCLIELHPKTFLPPGDSLGINAADTLVTAYGATGLPLFVCDGIKTVPRTAADVPGTYAIYRQAVAPRASKSSPVELRLSARADQNALQYTAVITADASLPRASNLGLFLVVVEDSVNAYGKQARHLARSVYPHSQGDPLPLPAGSMMTRSGSIPTSPGWLPYRMTLVAYVRDNTTREVLQSAKARVAAATAPPDAPAPDSPADGAHDLGLTPSLSWFASSGAASYALQVATNSTFESSLFTLCGLTRTTQTLVMGLSNSVTYYWRVNATNNAGTSGWSTVRSFTTTATKLLPGPALVWPEPGAAGISTSPALIWKTSSGAAGYSLQVATDDAFSNTVYARTRLTDTAQVVGGLANSTIYYWRVNALNVAGPSPWSDFWSFTTTTALPPAIPVLAAPADGESNAGAMPMLTWNASSGAGSYALQVSTSSSFSSLLHERSGLTGTSDAVSGLPPLTTYYWRVNASNASGTSGWSEPWSFTDAQGFTFSRLTAADPVLQAPDTTITYSLTSPLTTIGFHVYIRNLTRGRITVAGQSDVALNSDPSLFWGQLCTESQCLAPNIIGTEVFNAGATHHWTVDFVFNSGPPPVGLHYLTLTLWDNATPGSGMSRTLYLNVTP